jgi:hypothetical protein
MMEYQERRIFLPYHGNQRSSRSLESNLYTQNCTCLALVTTSVGSGSPCCSCDSNGAGVSDNSESDGENEFFHMTLLFDRGLIGPP